MKHLFLTIIGIAISTNSIAGAYKVVLHRDNVEHRDKRPTVTQIPDVEYDEGTLKIKCNTHTQYASIVIRDCKGSVIYSDNIVISPTTWCISLPDYVDSDKHTIEIQYSNDKLKGLF